MQRTRRELLSLLKRRGSATLEELAHGVGLAPITVRSHLNLLKQDGLIDATKVTGKVGRPFFVYNLTSAADDIFPKEYDRLAGSILNSVLAVCGRERLSRLCREVGELIARHYAERMHAADSLEERVKALAHQLNEDGALVEWEHDPESGAYTIRKHNCPYSCMSHEHPELCTIDLQVMRHLFDPRDTKKEVRVEHADCARCGEGECVYRIVPRPITVDANETRLTS